MIFGFTDKLFCRDILLLVHYKVKMKFILKYFKNIMHININYNEVFFDFLIDNIFVNSFINHYTTRVYNKLIYNF